MVVNAARKEEQLKHERAPTYCRDVIRERQYCLAHYR